MCGPSVFDDPAFMALLQELDAELRQEQRDGQRDRPVVVAEGLTYKGMTFAQPVLALPDEPESLALRVWKNRAV